MLLGWQAWEVIDLGQESGEVDLDFDSDPHIAGSFLNVLEEFLGPGPVLIGGVGR